MSVFVMSRAAQAETVTLHWQCAQTDDSGAGLAAVSSREAVIRFGDIFSERDPYRSIESVPLVWEKVFKKLVFLPAATQVDLSECSFDSVEALRFGGRPTLQMALEKACEKTRGKASGDCDLRVMFMIGDIKAKSAGILGQKTPSQNPRIPAFVIGGKIRWTQEQGLSKQNHESYLRSLAALYDPKKCDYGYKPEKIWAYIHSRDYLEKEYPALEKKHPHCRETLAKEVLDALKQQKLPEECFDERGASSPGCRAARQSLEFALGFLKDRLPARAGLDRVSSVLAGIDCKPPEAGLGAGFNQLLKDPQLSQCTALKAGESRKVTPNDLPQGFPNLPRYELKKNDAQNYTAKIRVAYTPEAQDAQFRARFQGCLDKAKNALLGPHGEHLNIQLEDPKAPPGGPPDQVVQADEVAPSLMSRSFANHYAIRNDYLDCPLVVHETLHLLGLVDEYKEVSSGFRTDPKTGKPEWVAESAEIPGFNCRAIGPSDSVMSNQNEAMSAVMGECITENCVAKDPSKPCDTESGTNVDGGCSGIDFAEQERPERERYTPWTKSACDALSKKVQIAPYPNGCQGHITISPQRKSLLMPAQFLAITQPGCTIDNPLYYACAATAYRSTIPGLPDKCPDQPKTCRTENWLNGP